MKTLTYLFGLFLLTASTLLPGTVHAGSGGYHDWFLKNKTPYTSIATLKDAAGKLCFSSYLEPQQELGMPKKIQQCPFPGLTIEFKIMQQGQTGTCSITLNEMGNVSFDGKECTQA